MTTNALKFVDMAQASLDEVAAEDVHPPLEHVLDAVKLLAQAVQVLSNETCEEHGAAADRIIVAMADVLEAINATSELDKLDIVAHTRLQHRWETVRDDLLAHAEHVRQETSHA